MFATLGRQQCGLSQTRMRSFGFLLVSLLGLAALSYYERLSNDRKNGEQDIHGGDLGARRQWESALNKSFAKHATLGVGPFYSLPRRYRLPSSE